MWDVKLISISVWDSSVDLHEYLTILWWQIFIGYYKNLAWGNNHQYEHRKYFHCLNSIEVLFPWRMLWRQLVQQLSRSLVSDHPAMTHSSARLWVRHFAWQTAIGNCHFHSYSNERHFEPLQLTDIRFNEVYIINTFHTSLS